MTGSRPDRSSNDEPTTDERPAPPFGIVHVLAAATSLLGILMIFGALSGGGGAGSYGVLVGALFLAAGVLRLRLLSARRRPR